MTGVKPIFSVNEFAHRIGIPRERLEKVAANIDQHYREWPLIDPKNPAKIRQVRSPLPELIQIQRLLTKRVFSQIPLNDNVHGGVAGRSTRSNAEMHLGKPCVVTVDVKQFYDRVRHKIVYQLFRKELGFGRDVARLITRLTTYNDALPQGAPTSLAVANMLLTRPLDIPLALEAKHAGVDATRFVDDIALSGRNPRPLINGIAKRLSQRRLPIHRRKAKPDLKCKLKIMPNCQPQEVTGLLVNRASGLSVSRARRDRVRSAINKLRGLSDVERKRAVESIQGRIQYVKQYNPGSAKRLTRCLNDTLRAQ